MSVALYRISAIAIPLFEVRVDPLFGADRLLGCEVFLEVCKPLIKLERDVDGWIIDTDEERAGLIFDLSGGEFSLEITLPLLKNLKRHHSNVCERLVRRSLYFSALIPVPRPGADGPY